jgi:hypothetical protein
MKRPPGARSAPAPQPARVWLALTALAACSQPGISTKDAGADAPAAAPDDDAGFSGPAFMLPDAGDGHVIEGPPPVAAELDCAAAAKTPGNAGCSFYAAQPPIYLQSCYAMFVVNPGTQPAKLTLERAGTTFDLGHVARVPRGSGDALSYAPFDAAAGLAPGDVALIFLAGQPSPQPGPPAMLPPGVRPPTIPVGLQVAYCPYGVTPALAATTEAGRGGTAVRPTWTTATGQAFHLASDRPVVTYDINPYGGAYSALTSASLLLPAEAWGTSHVAATPPYQSRGQGDGGNTPAYVLVVAAENGTDVALRPPAPIKGAAGAPVTGSGQVVHLHLDAGQFAQVVQDDADPAGRLLGLSGTLLSSNKPVGLVGGTGCFQMDAAALACDSGHQQIPPLSAWGHEYAAVRYRSRTHAAEEVVPWQIVAAVDGTTLTYAPKPPAAAPAYPAPAPATLGKGEAVQFWTAEPFVVQSQDAEHPIYVAGYMTGTAFLAGADAVEQGEGDPEFVNVVPTDQYLRAYTFLTDPTYPETSLVVVRRPGDDGRFADVKLGCAAAPIAGWVALGGYQFARVDLVTGKFQPVIAGCDNGRQQIASTAPFAVTVWGWGNKLVAGSTYVSYAYPAGAALTVVNSVGPRIVE